MINCVREQQLYKSNLLCSVSLQFAVWISFLASCLFLFGISFCLLYQSQPSLSLINSSILEKYLSFTTSFLAVSRSPKNNKMHKIKLKANRHFYKHPNKAYININMNTSFLIFSLSNTPLVFVKSEGKREDPSHLWEFETKPSNFVVRFFTYWVNFLSFGQFLHTDSSMQT